MLSRKIPFIPGVLLLAAISTSGASQGVHFWKKVAWTTPDGIQMAGLYHSSRLPTHYTWILLHGLGSGKEEWDSFAQQLGIQGEGVFIYDLRGHGSSTQSTSGQKVSYRNWQTAEPWAAMPGDLGSAVSMLHSRYQIPVKRIAVGGASLGANVALVYASRQPRVPALVLLSPGLEYAGIASEAPFKAFAQRPVFMAASPGDAYAFSSVRQLAGWRTDAACRVAEGPGGAHGVNMFQGSFTQQVLEWMKNIEK